MSNGILNYLHVAPEQQPQPQAPAGPWQETKTTAHRFEPLG